MRTSPKSWGSCDEGARPEAAFQLTDIRVSFGSTDALSGIRLSLAEGEQVGIIGPSGSGKTTLLRLLNGMQFPSGGDVHALGEDLSCLGPREMRRIRRRIAFVPQDLSLVPNLRVSQNVSCGRLGYGNIFSALRSLLVPARAELAEIHAVLEQVGIAEKLFERTDTLSGGQQQRVAVARALFQRPVALLADEPVSSVDPARADDTMALLTDLCRQRGITLCVSLHNLELARRYLPRLIGLRRGNLCRDAPTEAWTAEDFEQLYDLSAEEMLSDG